MEVGSWNSTCCFCTAASRLQATMAAVSSSNATSSGVEEKRSRENMTERTTASAVIRLTETHSWTTSTTTQSTVRRNVLSVNKSSVPLKNDGLSNHSTDNHATDVFSSNSTTAGPSGIATMIRSTRPKLPY